jgi:hypothetical protein
VKILSDGYLDKGKNRGQSRKDPWPKLKGEVRFLKKGF